MQNHVIDVNFFNDAIAEFAFNYDWYAISGVQVNSLGKIVTNFTKNIINGSLQTQGSSLQQSLSGNTENMQYKFYCRSLYRIGIGDFIFYKNRWLHVEAVHDYDEWGVREATLKMINLNNYVDFRDYLAYLNGEKII